MDGFFNDHIYAIAGAIEVIVALSIVAVLMLAKRTWKETCPDCGFDRKCYPSLRRGFKAGMLSTVIQTDCPKCGLGIDPNYVAHRADPLSDEIMSDLTSY